MSDYCIVGSPFDTRSRLHQRGKVVSGLGNPKLDTFLQYAPKELFLEGELYKFFSNRNSRVELALACRAQQEFTPIPGLTIPPYTGNENLYGATFEWYVREILMRELSFQSADFGVFLRDAPDGGDFDVLGFSGFDLVYVECKSGKPGNVSSEVLKNFIKRVHFLNCGIAVLYLDTLDLERERFDFSPLIEQYQGCAKLDLWKIKSRVRNATLYHTSFSNIYVVDCNSNSGNVIENIRFALDTHYSLKSLERKMIEVGPDSLNPTFFQVERK